MKKAFLVKQLTCVDQDVLNPIFNNSCKLISNIWNYCCGVLIWDKEFLDNIKDVTYKEDFLKAKSNPKIIHYTSPKKPWNAENEEHYSIFWKYAERTQYYRYLREAQIKSINRQKFELDSAYNKLNKLLLEHKRYILWGASEFLEDFLTKYSDKCYNILGIIDKNPSKWGENIKGYTIYSPDNISKMRANAVICTIKNSHEKRYEQVKEIFDNNYQQVEVITDIFDEV